MDPAPRRRNRDRGGDTGLLQGAVGALQDTEAHTFRGGVSDDSNGEVAEVQDEGNRSGRDGKNKKRTEELISIQPGKASVPVKAFLMRYVPDPALTSVEF